MSLSWFLWLYQFYGLFTAYLLFEEVMSVRLYSYPCTWCHNMDPPPRCCIVPSHWSMVHALHLTETQRKTSNFDMYPLNFISTCHFCFIQKIIYHLIRNWARFSLPKFCRSSIYVITNVKFSNSLIQNIFSFLQWTSMDFRKVKRLTLMVMSQTSYILFWVFRTY